MCADIQAGNIKCNLKNYLQKAYYSLMLSKNL